MSNSKETFFTSVGCMDGRVQEPIMNYGRKVFEAQNPDVVPEPGLVALVSQDNPDPRLLESIRAKMDISIKMHRSKGIVVHGHQECAGNPIDDETHRKQVLMATEVIRSFAPPQLRVIPVFVVRTGETSWAVEEL